MARAEHMVTDEQIQESSTSTTPSSRRRGSCRPRCSSSSRAKTQLREWLPKLVGIERVRRAARCAGARARRGRPRGGPRGGAHPARHDGLGALHPLLPDPGRGEAFAAGPVTLAVAHPIPPRDELSRRSPGRAPGRPVGLIGPRHRTIVGNVHHQGRELPHERGGETRPPGVFFTRGHPCAILSAPPVPLPGDHCPWSQVCSGEVHGTRENKHKECLRK